MKLFIKLKNFQYTTEVGDVSINCINGDIVISEATQFEGEEKSEEPVHVDQPEPFYKPSLGKRTPIDMVINLIKAGYSMEKIGEYTGIPAWKIRRINSGTAGKCKFYADKGIYKYPIREIVAARRYGDNVPVTICKGCNEPIPVVDLLTDPMRCYCKECAPKFMPSAATEHYTAVADLFTSQKERRHRTTHQEMCEVIKLLKLGYSTSQIAKKLDMARTRISWINRGQHSRCKEFLDVTFPIQHNTRGGLQDAWRKIPVTYCKECGEPIPLADLLKDPHCEYCPDCRAKPKEK